MVNFEYNRDKMCVNVSGTTDELLSSKESYDSYFASCRESGQGINSKDTVRYYALLLKLRELGETATNWFEENP